MSEAIKALVVIPTYNEAENIERLCKALCENPRVAGVLYRFFIVASEMISTSRRR